MDWTRVDGENRGEIVFYALSTCGWCRKTKSFLDELGVGYKYRYVDMAFGAEREELLKEMERWNPRRSFPTIVINKEKAIIGYKPDRIKEVLGL
jgi:glutaredoxin-like protein NrdH